ncbi:hypothetical protein B0A55_06490 [Friedmanniomyces simplex]|uniref:Uncharacterized protein n=1 Tax=Friedmanniomyces simplex TaxID=329884 RepID=A0A4U0XBT9_9PEZI|nr:hypothetical protein B0A55_06490 [Friedmanniomyces simplex]
MAAAATAAAAEVKENEDDGFTILHVTRRVRLESIDTLVERAEAFDALRAAYKNFVKETAQQICKDTDDELRMDLEDYVTNIMSVPKARFMQRASKGGKWFVCLEVAPKVLKRENFRAEKLNDEFWRDSEDAHFSRICEERRCRLQTFETGVKQAYQFVEEARKFQG